MLAVITLSRTIKPYIIITTCIFVTGLLIHKAGAGDTTSSSQKSFTMELTTKYDCDCSKPKGNKITCSFWIEKTEFTIGSVVSKETDTTASMTKAVAMAGSSGGLLLPVMILFPEMVKVNDFRNSAVSIIKAQITGKIPANNENVTLLINGIEAGKYTTDKDGHLTLSLTEDGVYEFIGFSEVQGLALDKQIYFGK